MSVYLLRLKYKVREIEAKIGKRQKVGIMRARNETKKIPKPKR